MADMFQSADAIGPRRKSLIDALGGGNTGIGGTPDPAKMEGPMPSSPLASAATPQPPVNAVPTNVSGGTGPFQSGNASVSGYLTDAMNAFAPTIRGIKDEAGRKSALNSYVSSLVPEVEKRGGKISDIHGDGANVDGRRIDFFGDVEGAALPQYLDVTDQQNAPQGGGINPLALSGNSNGDISAQLAQLSQQSPNLAKLIAQLGGQQ